jgi:hypothetical protein
MNDLELQKLIKKYKKSNMIDLEHILYSIDLCTNVSIPNSLLFNYDSSTISKCSSSSFFFEKTLEQKTQTKIKTNELYYGNGIIGNMYDIKECDYNWLLGYFFNKQFNCLLKKNTKCFFMGFNNYSFINGMKYFSTISNKSIYETINIDWVGMDLNSQLFENKITEEMIDGFKSNDLSVYSNLNQCKYIIENKFNKINLIINNIKPNIDNNKTLISASILALSILKKDGMLLTKILSPENWDGNFLHYILLFAMLFNSVKIFRYPICKKKYIFYKYYLVCNNTKSIAHNSILYRKLIMLLKDYEINKLVFLQNILDADDVKDCKKNILEIRDLFLNNQNENYSNPEFDLNEIINNFHKDLVNK